MKSFTERDPVRAAIVGSVLVLAVLALAFNFPKLPLVGDGPEYRAAFTDAGGLQIGEDVRVAGIKVGAVSDIELDGSHVVVSFHLKGTTLGSKTRAAIEIRTLLGQHYLSLTPDGPGELPPGSEIPLGRTTTPLNIVPAFQELTETIEQIDTEQLAQSYSALAGVLRKTAPEVRGTLDGLSALSRSIAKRDGQIQELFSRARSVSGTLAARDKELGELFADSDAVLGVLNDRRRAIRRIISGTDDLADQISGLVADNRETLTPMLRKLRAVVRVLNANDKQLDELIGNMTVYAREFVNVGGTGRWFDSTATAPRGFAVCSNPPNTNSELAELLEPLLSELNQKVNGSSSPCLPIGSATDTGGGR